MSRLTDAAKKDFTSSSKRRSPKIEVDERVAGLYDLGEKIGEGHCSVVRVARHVFTDEQVAVKIINKEKLDEQTAKNLTYEVLCMKLVQHPYVVRLFEVLDTPRVLYLVQEYADGGDLHEYLASQGVRGHFDKTRAKRYFSQIVQAIAYCHKLHVVHRDLKPQNVVFFRCHDVVKVTDFGLSKRFVPGDLLRTPCGSLAFSAPEMFIGDTYEAPAVDIWSLGVILYMLVCGRPPFQETNDSETITRILDANYRRPSASVSADCCNLISQMLQKDPAKRANLDQVIAHAWLIGCTASGSSPGSAAAANGMLQGPLQGTLQVPVAQFLSTKQLSRDDEESIVRTICAAGMATEDELRKSLDSDTYDNITATYHLLAERVLRRRFEEQKAEAAAAAAASSHTLNRQPTSCDNEYCCPISATVLAVESTRSLCLSRSVNSLVGRRPKKPCHVIPEEKDGDKEVDSNEENVSSPRNVAAFLDAKTTSTPLCSRAATSCSKRSASPDRPVSSSSGKSAYPVPPLCAAGCSLSAEKVASERVVGGGGPGSARVQLAISRSTMDLSARSIAGGSSLLDLNEQDVTLLRQISSLSHLAPSRVNVLKSRPAPGNATAKRRLRWSNAVHPESGASSKPSAAPQVPAKKVQAFRCPECIIL